MNDFEQFLRDAGQIRRERLERVVGQGVRVGAWAGKGIGFALAAIALTAYYLSVWTFTGTYLIGRAIADSIGERDDEVESRRRIPASVRLDIARSQDWMCHYGGRRLPANGFHIDHVVPWVEHGSDDPSNLVASCPRHNLMKSDRDYDDFIDDLRRDPTRAKCGN